MVHTTPFFLLTSLARSNLLFIVRKLNTMIYTEKHLSFLRQHLLPDLSLDPQTYLIHTKLSCNIAPRLLVARLGGCDLMSHASTSAYLLVCEADAAFRPLFDLLGGAS